MSDTVRVIIAKYKENVSWADALGYDYIVYDKSDEPDTKSMPLANIGREAHTYLTHIVRHYDQLAPMNVFLQGDPFDHIAEQGKGSVALLRSMLEPIVERMVPFKGLAWFKLKSDALGNPHELNKPENEGRWPGWGRDIPVGMVFEHIFDAVMPKEIICRAPTGNFCVTGERIRTRPKSFYAYCLQLVEADPHDEYNTGHAFERLWQHIFNGNVAWNKNFYG